jgi:hypothetical protein
LAAGAELVLAVSLESDPSLYDLALAAGRDEIVLGARQDVLEDAYDDVVVDLRARGRARSCP